MQALLPLLYQPLSHAEDKGSRRSAESSIAHTHSTPPLSPSQNQNTWSAIDVSEGPGGIEPEPEVGGETEQHFEDAYLVTSPLHQPHDSSQLDDLVLLSLDAAIEPQALESPAREPPASEPSQANHSAQAGNLDALFLPYDQTYWYCDIRQLGALTNGESSCFLLTPDDSAVLNAGIDPTVLNLFDDEEPEVEPEVEPEDELSEESLSNGYEGDDELDMTSWGTPL